MTAFFSPVRQALLATSLLCAAASAVAQWQWIDGSGRRVYSDRPPPASVPLKNILKRPGGMAAPVTVVSNTETVPAASAPVASASAAATAPKPSASTQKAAAEQKKKEEEEAAKKKAEEEKIAKTKADNCQRAKTALTTIKSGTRVATSNSKGEREIMDDKARAAEEKRLNDVIASECSAAK